MEFSRPVIERGGCLTVTIPCELVKFYGINNKDFCTFEFIKNHRDNNGRK